jgi:hypothetical protein
VGKKKQLALSKSFSRLKTNFYRSLLKNGGLDIGRKLLRAEEYRLLFFRKGVTISVFSAVGKVPVNTK